MKKKLPATSTKETQQKYRPANVFNVPGGNPLQVRMLKSNLLSPPGRFRPRGRHTYSYSYLFSLNEITSAMRAQIAEARKMRNQTAISAVMRASEASAYSAAKGEIIKKIAPLTRSVMNSDTVYFQYSV